MSKQAIRISADSTCDLSPELLQQYDIKTLPLYVVLEASTSPPMTCTPGSRPPASRAAPPPSMWRSI